MNACTYHYVHVCMYVRTYVCMYVCMYVCTYICGMFLYDAALLTL